MATTRRSTSAGEQAGELRTVARELYAAPLEEFVATRTARARELREAGERELAAQVAKLRKPTRAAWAIDQAVHAEPELVEQLMATVAAMQSPGNAARLRELADEHEEHVRSLARAAHDTGGGSAGDLGAAIRTAAISPEAQAFVDGTLATIPSAGDESLAAALAAGAALGMRRTPRRAARPAGDDEQRARREREREHREQARRMARELADARRAVTRAERSLDDARARVEQLEAELAALESDA